MKSLMTMVAALAACMVFAAPEGGAPGAGPHGGPRFGGRPGMGPHGGDMMMMDPIVNMVMNPKVAEKIGLSEEQQAKLRELKGNGGRHESQKKVRALMQEQAELMKADKIDEAAVMAKIDEVFEIRKEIAKEQAKRLIEIKSVLTPEQIAKAREEMKAVFAERREHRGHHGGPRGSRPEGGDAATPPAQPPAEQK